MLKLLGIPPEVRGTRDKAQLARMGRSLRRVRVPNKEVLTRELEVVKKVGIPLLVITGGWNPAFEVSSDAVAAAAGGRRAVIQRGAPFPADRVGRTKPGIRCLHAGARGSRLSAARAPIRGSG